MRLRKALLVITLILVMSFAIIPHIHSDSYSDHKEAMKYPVAGRVLLKGKTNHSGIKVTIEPAPKLLPNQNVPINPMKTTLYTNKSGYYGVKKVCKELKTICPYVHAQALQRFKVTYTKEGFKPWEKTITLPVIGTSVRVKKVTLQPVIIIPPPSPVIINGRARIEKHKAIRKKAEQVSERVINILKTAAQKAKAVNS